MAAGDADAARTGRERTVGPAGARPPRRRGGRRDLLRLLLLQALLLVLVSRAALHRPEAVPASVYDALSAAFGFILVLLVLSGLRHPRVRVGAFLLSAAGAVLLAGSGHAGGFGALAALPVALLLGPPRAGPGSQRTNGGPARPAP